MTFGLCHSRITYVCLKAMKRRVHFGECYRESRQLKRDADEEVEDGLGAAHRPAERMDQRIDPNQKRQAATGTPVIALQYKEVSLYLAGGNRLGDSFPY